MLGVQDIKLAVVLLEVKSVGLDGDDCGVDFLGDSLLALNWLTGAMILVSR